MTWHQEGGAALGFSVPVCPQPTPGWPWHQPAQTAAGPSAGQTCLGTTSHTLTGEDSYERQPGLPPTPGQRLAWVLGLGGGDWGPREGAGSRHDGRTGSLCQHRGRVCHFHPTEGHSAHPFKEPSNPQKSDRGKVLTVPVIYVAETELQSKAQGALPLDSGAATIGGQGRAIMVTAPLSLQSGPTLSRNHTPLSLRVSQPGPSFIWPDPRDSRSGHY